MPSISACIRWARARMKYNPRVNEAVARVEGIANGHPYQPERISQGALQILKTLSECLIEITGMDAITLQPAAGAHGEMTGLLMVRAYHHAQGRPRKKVLIPDSAMEPIQRLRRWWITPSKNLKSDSRGMVDIAALEAQMSEDVAALMLTNPTRWECSNSRFTKLPTFFTPKAACSIWMAQI